MSSNSGNRPPVLAIGGVGGSGTRLVAQLIESVGFHMGDDLNESRDTLWFTLLFKREEILRIDDPEFERLTWILMSALRRGQAYAADDGERVRQLCAQDRLQHSTPWLRARADSLLASASRIPVAGALGWKEPNTHMVIGRLWKYVPSLRYVHVVRNGVDMAWSRNQNQLRLWGEQVLGEDGPTTPRRSLAFWRCVHERMQRLLVENPHRMYWLDYDALCREPEVESEKLCRFIGCHPAQMTSVLTKVHAPSRRNQIDLSELEPDDVEYVRSLGYLID